MNIVVIFKKLFSQTFQLLEMGIRIEGTSPYIWIESLSAEYWTPGPYLVFPGRQQYHNGSKIVDGLTNQACNVEDIK